MRAFKTLGLYLLVSEAPGHAQALVLARQHPEAAVRTQPCVRDQHPTYGRTHRLSPKTHSSTPAATRTPTAFSRL